jgi:Fe-S-cluster containining protein
MNLTPGPFLINRRRYLPLLSRLEILFDEMDRAYAQVSDRYGFQCNGCSDNCCLTRFYHHTLLEYLYLVEGIRSLEPDRRRSIRKAALAANTRMYEADQRGETLHIMCPLNRDGQCVAYPYRPMICRLHGIPHELHRPGGKIIKNPGCDSFFRPVPRPRHHRVYPIRPHPFLPTNGDVGKGIAPGNRVCRKNKAHHCPDAGDYY